MKACPQCSFSNNDNSPTCIWCNELLVNVRAVPSTDPASAEYQERQLTNQRGSILRRRLLTAVAFYSLMVTATAVIPGLILAPSVLLLYFASGVIVGLATARRLFGSVSASLGQGLFSLLLVLCFGPQQPLIFFMLIGHILLPTLLSFWTELIHDAHR